MFEAEAVIHDGNGDRRETIYTQLDWQLVDERKHHLDYYEKLFSDLKRIIGSLPDRRGDHKQVLSSLLGNGSSALGSRIVGEQMRRFTR